LLTQQWRLSTVPGLNSQLLKEVIMTDSMPNRVEIENECHDAYAELLVARERFLRAEAAHGRAVAASTGGWSTITVELPPAASDESVAAEEETTR
jgi:hypothetical protein